MSTSSLVLTPVAQYHGPSPFATAPVLLMRVAPGPAAGGDEPTVHLGRAYERLAAAFPQWLDAAAPRASALVLAAHAVAHCALGLLNEVRGFLHDAGAAEGAGGVLLWVEFHHAPATLDALRFAVDLLSRAAAGPITLQALQPELEALWSRVRAHHPDYQANVLMAAALARDIPFLPLMPQRKIWQYGWGRRARVFHASMSNADGFVGGQMQHSKLATKSLLTKLGVPTPRVVVVSTPEDLDAAATAVGWPCVLKPQDMGGGRGVTAGIGNLAELRAAFSHARGLTQDALLVEAFVPGADHRLMVLDGRLIAAIRREPTRVTGDGSTTVAQLLAQVNRPRSRNLARSRYLRAIPADDVLERHLATQGVALHTVLAAGQCITLRSNANLSTGGVCIDVTQDIHPATRRMAEMVAQTMGLYAAGLDFITTDIALPWQEGGAFIEVNARPGIDAMIAAGQDPLPLGIQVLGDLPARIAVRLVVCAAHDIPLALRALRARALAADAGWTCGGQAGVGDCALGTPPSFRAAVEALLLNRSVGQVLIIQSVEELTRSGMPVDKVDRAALCGPTDLLAPMWSAVVEAHAGELDRFDDWTSYAASADWLAFGRASVH